MTFSNKNISFSETFFKPIIDHFSASKKQYNCNAYSDLSHLKTGIKRCFNQVKSGREFIQEMADSGQASPSLSLYFKALKSKRRLENLTSVNDLMRQPLSENTSDPFNDVKELKNWDIYAVDGHYQEHATHDPIHVDQDGKESRPAVGHFFRLNMRNHHMSLLDTMKPDEGKKAEHDTHLIQRVSADELRYGAAKGKKVLLVWDKACIDYQAWSRLKRNNGVYFLTQEKSNSAAVAIGGDTCDHEDSRNEGIVSVNLVKTPEDHYLRRIVYINPTDDKKYTYITNDLTLPAYLLVIFYKHRWEIEKCYYQFKSKFGERKSWASKRIAKKSQAVFQCLLHNLCILTEQMAKKEGLVDKVSEKRKKGRKREPQLGYINNFVKRASHRTSVFIRWLRNHVNNKGSITNCVGRGASMGFELDRS